MCARFLSQAGHEVIEVRPPGIEQAYELEMALLGADGAEGIDAYLESAGSTQTHSLLEAGFVSRMRQYRTNTTQFATLWAQWDVYRTGMAQFFRNYDALLCPVYTQVALQHGESVKRGNFEGFSYTMAWNLSGNPAATVRCAESGGLPVNVQVVTARWRDLLALEVCSWIEKEFGGWRGCEAAQNL